MAYIHLTIASPSETFFDGEAQSVTLPGSTGEFQVLSKHEPLITTLKEGVIRYQIPAGVVEMPVTRGVVEIAHNHCTVLV